MLAGRRAAEAASRAALESLGVFAERRPEHLNAEQAGLRNGLRAKWRQLGGERELLVGECAYEQWHRLLFARFLADNGLLLHPEYRAPVTLEECEDLSEELGEPDGWSVAARFAAEILPGIFRLDDPCVRLRLAPEGRYALEQVLARLPAEAFHADDALGWVYQYWQKEKKDEVNSSERKIGSADLGPVTQLFTEHYMVRFLLENSLGAWWASRHPESPLISGFEYLRIGEDGKPAAGSFEGWPARVAEVTVMDPCCGSGHFLVEAFSMLWQMRAEEEGLGAVEAQNAVLGDNLFGLELDPRCVQIAMFAVALQAWKAGGGWRQIPVPNIACSGIPVKASFEEWKKLAGGDQRLENALERLHVLFRDADTLGSLVNPRYTSELVGTRSLQQSLDEVDWQIVAPILDRATRAEHDDPAQAVLGASAVSLAAAAAYSSRQYTLLITNPPFLGRGSQTARLSDFIDAHFAAAREDLAMAFLLRAGEMAATGGTVSLVTPQSWLFMHRFRALRRRELERCRWRFFAHLGEGAFASAQAAGALTALICLDQSPPPKQTCYAILDVSSERGADNKASGLKVHQLEWRSQDSALASPDCSMAPETEALVRLGDVATTWQGLVTSDVARYIVNFWEVPSTGSVWERFVTAPAYSAPYSGRDSYLRWEDGRGDLVNSSNAHNFNPKAALGNKGVLVASMRILRVALYDGEMFNDKSVPIIPLDQDLQPALWAFCSSPEFSLEVRKINKQVNVGSGYFLRVPFDVERWQKVAAEAGALPDPWSDDPTQWLFGGRPEMSTAPLQVAVGRLLGYRWPEQAEGDDLEALADGDGVVCLPAVAGESPAADRLQEVLAVAFGESWSPAKLKELLDDAASKKKTLEGWLHDEFFKQHCALFGNRPFVWHIWDGQREGFSALVNYHRLDHQLLEKLTYTYLGQDWMERQRAAVRDGVPGAEGRLAAARDLQRRLQLILEGETPYDIYVRWKQPYEQPIGWEPDVNDGVRLNIRPFVEAAVLRTSFNIHWKKDRGRNPDGTERHNDLHLALPLKFAARTEAGRA